MLVDLHHVTGVRCDPQTAAGGVGRDLQPFRHSGHPGRVDLDDAEGIRGNEAGELMVGVNAFAGGDVEAGRALEPPVVFQVIGMERFFHPVHLRFLEHGHDLVGRVQVPALIGVAHERDVVADLASYRPHPPRVLTPVRMAHLHLHPPPALLDQRRQVAGELGHAEVQPAAVRVVRLDRIGGAAEQPPQRNIGPLRGQVPQGDVHHGQCHVHGTRPAYPMGREPVQPFPRPGDVCRGVANQGRRIVIVNDVAQQVGGAMNARYAGPDPAVGRLDLHHRHRPMRHRRRRIGDWPGEGDGQGVGLDRGNGRALIAPGQVTDSLDRSDRCSRSRLSGSRRRADTQASHH